MEDNDQEQKVEKKQDMNPESTTETTKNASVDNDIKEKSYYVSVAMTFGVHPLIIERDLATNNISFDEASKLINLGLQVYTGALYEINSHGDLVMGINKDKFKYFCEKALKDFEKLRDMMNDNKGPYKIQFREGVSFIDSVLLIDGLQKHWFKKQARNAYWTNFFNFPTEANDFPTYMSKKLNEKSSVRDLFTKYLLKPGMTMGSDYSNLEKMDKMLNKEKQKNESDEGKVKK